ncbi:MAG: helix-turn-helix domain-containing protein [Lachnospiraceae bacterium]|nr:helix-turn-helix domain-containing protein [Lachnospiraceae bacterium]
MKFGDNLRRMRELKKISQEQLAELMGVSRQSVSKWEREESFPSMERLLKLCQIFDCDLADLLTRSGSEELQNTDHAEQEEDNRVGEDEMACDSQSGFGFTEYGAADRGLAGEQDSRENFARAEKKPESKELTNKAVRITHTRAFRDVCTALLLLAVILLVVWIVRGTLTGNEELTSLYHYKAESIAKIIDAESAHAYYEEVQNRLYAGQNDCVCNAIMYLAEDEGQDYLDTSTLSYALYSETWSHGNAILVTLSVVTVYDGETEKPGLAWVDITPQVLTKFEVDISVLKGDEAVTDDTLVYICGYTVRIPEKMVNSEFAEQYGYQKGQDGTYDKTEHIFLISESVFQ